MQLSALLTDEAVTANHTNFYQAHYSGPDVF